MPFLEVLAPLMQTRFRIWTQEDELTFYDDNHCVTSASTYTKILYLPVYKTGKYNILIMEY